MKLICCLPLQLIQILLPLLEMFMINQPTLTHTRSGTFAKHCISCNADLLLLWHSVYVVMLARYSWDTQYMLQCWPATFVTLFLCCNVTPLLLRRPVVMLPCYSWDTLYMLWCWPATLVTSCIFFHSDPPFLCSKYSSIVASATVYVVMLTCYFCTGCKCGNGALLLLRRTV